MPHTPGPWRIIGRTNCLGTYTVFHGYGERTDNQICQVASKDDARLVAAAPRLLAACQFAVQWLSGEDAEILISAIAQATGTNEPPALPRQATSED